MRKGNAVPPGTVSEVVEHSGDAEAYVVFAEHMGWLATWEQLGPVGRSGFIHAFAAVRAAGKRQAGPGSAEHSVHAAKKSDRASGAEVLAVLRQRRAARQETSG